jgi:hypothetical protein
MAVLKDATVSLYGTGADIDSSGNIYSVGYADTAGNDPVVLTKYNSAGTILFQYAYTKSGTDFSEARCAVASNGDIYIWAQSGGSNLIKLNSSGVVQWSYNLSESTNGNGPIYIDGSTIYTGAYTSTGALLCSFDTSGTLNWTRRFSTSGRFGVLNGIVVSPSGYVYACAVTGVSGSSNGTIVRLDASGNNVWIREINANVNTSANAIATDASNNLYVAFNSSTFSGIYVYNSSYTGISSATTSSAVSINNIQRDGSGNIYAYSDSDRLFKLNSSLSEQFQRRISGTFQGFNYGFMKLLSGKIYINANNSGVALYNFFAMKVPDDGTSTGTRSVASVNYSYASSATYSWSAGGTPTTSGSATQSTVSATLSSITVTRSTPTYTQTVTTF